MKKYILYPTLILTGIVLFTFCKKEYDHPPLKNVNASAQLTVAQLKARVPASSTFYKFGMGDTNLYGTVLADETSGNIYKQTFIMDDNGGAIQLNMQFTGGFAVGDKIRINLNGLYLVNANNMIYIDSVDIGKSVVKQSSGNIVTPKVVTITEILAGSVPSNSNSLQSQLVRIDNAEFVEKGMPFADAIGKASLNRTLKVCGGTNSVTVRTSGYANFAAKPIPSGSGYMVAIVTQYNSTMQLTIRDYQEIQMNAAGCPPPSFTLAPPVASLNENFSSIGSSNSTFTTNGWMNYASIGNALWKTNINGALKAMKASAFNSGDANNEMYFISPPIIYTPTMTLSFKTAFGFWDSGHPNAITALVSTDFTGNNANTANWTPVVGAVYAAGTGSFYPNATTNSGVLTLSNTSILNGYSGNFFVAFKYTGSTTYNSDIYVDDVIVQ
ncbi:MAG: choice-of-anchor J domain-containing protein [Sphingobacteriaceae bacterium]|nr:choice-of-anchor J domain-containing protein [Sphingobacteriaceae bacterium]